MKTLIASFIALLCGHISYSLDIRGRVIDDSDQPIEYANVVLFQDSTFISGVVTNEEGFYSISTSLIPSHNSTLNSSLNLQISLMGFESQKLIVNPLGEMGTTILFPGSITLNEVQVKAIRPLTTVKGNSLITNVENSSLAFVGTAKDVLARIPMVIDNGGTLEVFGKGVPIIYINGRKVLDILELKQLNSQDIKNVEVITNPGATYTGDVKSVIRIRTKPPKGEGWSGTLNTDNGIQNFYQTGNTVDFKYRIRGLELFANYGWWKGTERYDRTNDMITQTSKTVYNQIIRTEGKERYNDMNGKLGFSWIINSNHEIGAFYKNSWNRHTNIGTIPSEIWQNGSLEENSLSFVNTKYTDLPKHYANIYYNGAIGKFEIDFNTDYLWYKNRKVIVNDESNQFSEDRIVSTWTTNRSKMLAEKLVLSYTVFKGQFQVGQEYTASRMSNLFKTNLSEIGNADNNIEESNLAVFVDINQMIGRFQVNLGLRYEHIKYNNFELGQNSDTQRKIYNNLFPSIDISTRFGSVNMGLNYSVKTMRPSYSQLDGTIKYINSLTYETGNPYLKPTKIKSIQYIAQWRNFFTQLTYSYYKDGVYFNTVPYGEDEEVTLIKTTNLPHRHYFQGFVGCNYNKGFWYPKVNVGLMKQWLTLLVNNVSKKMNSPIFMVQWQNAIHLPYDIWLNLDAQLMSTGYDNNIKLSNNPWFINAKLYKGFLNDSFSVTFEIKDIFNSSKQSINMYNNSVFIVQKNNSPSRLAMLNFQYRFNTSLDRYRGKGAGTIEKSRF